MKSRYGEILRIWQGDRLYILKSHKIPLVDVLNNVNQMVKKSSESFCANISLEISTKTAKKSRGKGHKIELKYSLINGKENVISLVKEISRSMEEYLNKWSPTFVCVGIYGGGREVTKRERLYSFLMASYGYSVYEINGRPCNSERYIIYIRK